MHDSQYTFYFRMILQSMPLIFFYNGISKNGCRVAKWHLFLKLSKQLHIMNISLYLHSILVFFCLADAGINYKS